MAVLTREAGVEQALARRFFVLALGFAAVYAVITPPFAASDEVQHFARAYELSRAQVHTRADAQGAYFELPQAFAQRAEHYGQVLAGIHERVDLREIASDLGSRDDVANLTRVANSGRAAGPLAYAPQLPALWLARALDLPALGWLYLARLAGLLSFALLTAWSLSLVASLPFQWLALALTPALLAQAASATPDGLTLGLSFAFFALVLHSVTEPAALSRRRRWALLAIFGALASCAPVFLTFALALPAVRWLESEMPRQRRSYLLTATALASIAQLASALAVEGASGLVLSARSSAQLAFMTQHPGAALSAWLSGMFHDSTQYLAQLLAVRDVLSKEMRFSAGLLSTFYAELLFFLSWGALHAARKRYPQLRLATRWLLASALAYAVGVFLLVYLRENELGSARLIGVHGRALLPAAPAALIALAWRGRPIATRFLLRADGKLVQRALIALNVIWLAVMFGRYYAAPTWPYLFRR